MKHSLQALSRRQKIALWQTVKTLQHKLSKLKHGERKRPKKKLTETQRPVGIYQAI